MTNKKINAGSMVSSKGYSLRRLDRHQLQYKQADKVLTMEVEAGPRDLAVYLSVVKHWDRPHENENIGEQELAVIRDHIQEGLKFLGTKTVFG